jgi:hypothetical protein
MTALVDSFWTSNTLFCGKQSPVSTVQHAKTLILGLFIYWQVFRYMLDKAYFMTGMKKIIGSVSLLGILILSLSGCYETHYYHHNHHHTRGWYDRHHTPPPAGVDFNVDVHN